MSEMSEQKDEGSALSNRELLRQIEEAVQRSQASVDRVQESLRKLKAAHGR